MSATDKLFTGSIPEFYDRLLVPLIFEPYAHDLAAKTASLAPLAPLSVLEVATGTGVGLSARQARTEAGRALPVQCVGRIEENEFAEEVTRALAVLFPADPPRFLLSHRR